MMGSETRNGFGFKEKVLGFLTGWYGISLINAWVVFVSANIIAKMIPMLCNTANNIQELEEMVDGIATIFVAYGVALEERGLDTRKLLRSFTLPRNWSCTNGRELDFSLDLPK